MNEPRDYHTKSDRGKQISWYYSDVESNFKNDINELIYKTKADSQFLKTNLWLQKGKNGAGGGEE